MSKSVNRPQFKKGQCQCFGPGYRLIVTFVRVVAVLLFSSSCLTSQDPLGFFFLNFLIIFSNRSLFLPFRNRDNLPSSRNPKPRISSPISISHEPGVNGVTRARKPRIIQIMPIDFFTIFWVPRSLLLLFAIVRLLLI